MKPKLLVDFCSYKAAKFAVMNWHYSKTMPAGKLIKIGAWEDNKFVGVVLFGRGATFNIGSPYELEQVQVCELVRVALSNHVFPVTAICRYAISLLKRISPRLRLIVSYADTAQGHRGCIYQAGNWIYQGEISDRAYYILGQDKLHGRTVYSKYGTQSLEWLRDNVDANARLWYTPPKHKYLYPLDRAMRRQIEPLAQPYPKHAGG